MTLKSSRQTNTAWLVVAVGAIAVLLSGCASSGPPDNPIVRKFSWYSYLEGGDIRATCGSAAANQYRMVYNGVFTEQVRTYDISADGHLEVGVIEPAHLDHLSVSSLSDLLNPWRAKTANRMVSSAQVDDIANALQHDGAFGAPAVGTELSSRGFYWTIAACHQGQYHFTALAWPSPAWDSATFPDVLLALDPSAIAVNPPRDTGPLRTTARRSQGNFANEFHTKVGTNGLAGFTPILP